MARRKVATVVTLAAVLSAMIGADAAANSDAAELADPCQVFERAVAEGLLEPFEDAALRDQRASVLLDSADRDCTFAIRVAAGLYAQGDQHPSRLLPKDLAASESGFLRVLETGDLTMLFRLSYLASARDDWESAMGWAQLAGRVATMVESRDGRQSEAEATRLLELFAQRPDSGEAEAIAAIEGLMATRGDSIRKGLAAYDDRKRQPPDPAQLSMHVTSRYPPAMRSVPRVDYQHAHVAYVVGVDSQGRVARHWWFDAVPDPKLANTLGSVAGQLRYSADRGAGPLRLGIQVMAFSNGEFGLGFDGSELTQRDSGQDAGPF